MKKYIKNQSGALIVLVMVFTSVFLILAMGLVGIIIMQRNLGLRKVAYAEAIQIAEAGANYYRWHLAHAPTDFQDGTGQAGPYIHNFTDPSGGTIGQFSLNITPPATGSTMVTIESTGWMNNYPKQKRIVKVRYGIPSLAHFSFLTNSNAWFGENESTSGPAHSNGGIRMDGTNDSQLTSAQTTYLCTPDHGCNDVIKPGIWGAGANYNLWKFPVTRVDFDIVTMNLAQMKTDAQAHGKYFPSAGYGYYIEFKADGTFDIYQIDQLKDCVDQLDDDWNDWVCQAEEIDSKTFLNNYPIPDNGLIFVEDNLWVDGVVKGKVTLAAGKFPDNSKYNKSIRINGNLTYLARDGTNALGLIAQKNIMVPRYAPTDLTIDAVLLAQKGRIARNYYDPRLVQDKIEIYGGVVTNKTWTWSWVSGGNIVVDGYANTSSIYDANLTYSPPPSFPTSGEYTFISWEEEN